MENILKHWVSIVTMPMLSEQWNQIPRPFFFQYSQLKNNKGMWGITITNDHNQGKNPNK